MMLAHLQRMARYNRWANERLHDACAALPDDVYFAPRRAFFGSIHGTLNHLIVADRLWLARIEGLEPPYQRLDEQPYAGRDDLRAARVAEDARMIALVDALDEGGLQREVVYRMMTRPETRRTPLHLCWLHMFNHQTHHRGQVHDQLSQTDVPPPPLDLILYARDAP